MPVHGNDFNAFIEKRAFCVAQLKSGAVGMKSGLKAAEFIPLLKNASVAWIDVAVEDFKKEAPLCAESMGFSKQLVARLLNKKESAYEDFDDEMGLVLPAVNIEGFNVQVNKVLILIKNNLVLSIHWVELHRFIRLRRYAETFMRKFKRGMLLKDKVTNILIRVIDENNGRNFDYLRRIEEQGDELSRRLADSKTPRTLLGSEIYKMKHALITYLSAMWSAVDVITTLRYGDPALLTDNPKILARIDALANEVNNHIGLAEHLSEVLASGLEVLQSIYNNQLQILNNKLAMVATYLAIIGTAVLVPNTLATALSNPAYGFGPKDADLITAILVVSTIVSTALVYLWLKKADLFPHSTE